LYTGDRPSHPPTPPFFPELNVGKTAFLERSSKFGRLFYSHLYDLIVKHSIKKQNQI
jgi:hypothetical protein